MGIGFVRSGGATTAGDRRGGRGGAVRDLRLFAKAFKISEFGERDGDSVPLVCLTGDGKEIISSNLVGQMTEEMLLLRRLRVRLTERFGRKNSSSELGFSGLV